MALKFLNLQKILLKMDVKYLGTTYGSYGVCDDKEFAKKLRQKRLWVALADNGELKVSERLLNCGNHWLDTLANLKDNSPEEFEEIVSC